ncbi:hypothetical protein [Ornithinimicrobium sp. Y1694]
MRSTCPTGQESAKSRYAVTNRYPPSRPALRPLGPAGPVVALLALRDT